MSEWRATRHWNGARLPLKLFEAIAAGMYNSLGPPRTNPLQRGVQTQRQTWLELAIQTKWDSRLVRGHPAIGASA